jgi:hypothetical protein
MTTHTEELDRRVRAIIDPARESDGGNGTMIVFGFETLYDNVRLALVAADMNRMPTIGDASDCGGACGGTGRVCYGHVGKEGPHPHNSTADCRDDGPCPDCIRRAVIKQARARIAQGRP